MKQCLLCLDFTQENICLSCKKELPWALNPCLKPTGLWDSGFSPLLYLSPITQLISRLKFSRQFFQARVLTDLFLEKLPEGPRPDLLLPVPLHPWRILQRGFNQSTELTRLLSRALHIPYCPYRIKRIKHTFDQKKSDRRKRHDNVRDAFILRHPIQVSRIALIDDVFTTGETLGEICRTIRATNPTLHIDVWTMAQVGLRPPKTK